jgi:methylated-DNA-protein-cysteine methyltransferase-like protein
MDSQFTSPPDRALYHARVWELVRQIPVGQVTTYGFIASLISPPFGMSLRDYAAWGARWVGGAMAACPADVPWQRVINSQGKISARHSAEEQRRLLEEEGITFDSHDRIDLARFGWKGPSEG